MWSPRSPSGCQGKRKRLEESNFAQTCNLLSRYVKEKGSLRDLNLEIGGKVESLEALVKPGSFLAANSGPLTNGGKSAHSSLENPIVVEEDASNRASTSKDGTTREPKTAQLTIFYSGKVLVFEDYPADKVRDLVHVAKKSSSQMSYGITSRAIKEKSNPAASTSSPRDGLPPRPQAAASKQPVGVSCSEKMNPSTSEAGPSKAQEQSPPSEGNGSDLPIARRSSLHRFLEKRKRKDRAAVRGPYQNQENLATFKGDEQLDLNNFPNKD